MFNQRNKRKWKFNWRVYRDASLLILHGFIKIDPTVKKPKFKDFVAYMERCGFF